MSQQGEGLGIASEALVFVHIGGVTKKAELMLSIRAFFDTNSKHPQV